jgi:hypothetical protein
MQRRVDDEILAKKVGWLSGVDRIPIDVFTLFRDIKPMGAIGVIVSTPKEFSEDGIVS